MSEEAKALKSRLALLSPEDRAELADFLIESLDEEQEEGWEEAWNAELTRRLREIEEGKVAGVPAEQVIANFRKISA